MSTESDTSAAVRELGAALHGETADLVMIFASHHHGPEFTDLLSDLHARLSARNLIGCTGEGIIGPDREVEHAPAIAVWTARMPGVRVLPFVLDQEDVERLGERSESWRDHLGLPARDDLTLVVLPEPYSIDAERCVDQFDAAYPGCKIVGGMASGASARGQNRLFLGDQVLRQGLVGVSLAGPIEIQTVVSQGCRPVGEPFVVTRAQNNIIYELRGRPAVEVLRDVYQQAGPDEQSLMQTGVHLGTVIDEQQGRFGTGDFLVRNVMGIVEDSAIAVTTLIRPGQTIQFHVRDSRSASEELKKLLSGTVSNQPATPAGGLLFSCNGRGTRLFGAPNHDIGLINRFAQGCQVAGFFAQGEIGPIGRKTFIHGFTSSLILFRAP